MTHWSLIWAHYSRWHNESNNGFLIYTRSSLRISRTSDMTGRYLYSYGWVCASVCVWECAAKVILWDIWKQYPFKFSGLCWERKTTAGGKRPWDVALIAIFPLHSSASLQGCKMQPKPTCKKVIPWKTTWGCLQISVSFHVPLVETKDDKPIWYD